jgi:hypothetical protein
MNLVCTSQKGIVDSNLGFCKAYTFYMGCPISFFQVKGKGEMMTYWVGIKEAKDESAWVGQNASQCTT